MTTCTQLSDRMPDVALGRTRWTEAEEGHLAACDDCRAEWELVRATSRLGSTLAPPDPAKVSARLLERLARERDLTRTRARRWTAAGLAAAAAVALAVWTGRQESRDRGAPAPPIATAPVVARHELTLLELDDLPEEALDSLLQVLDEPLARADAYQLPALGGSGDRELERALTGLEG
jgi:anti-sigma factor RsiW